MKIAKDGESLTQKLMRLSDAHNSLVAQTQNNVAQTNRLINNLMYVLDDEIDDFAEKYKKADFVTGLENVIESRLGAHLSGDLVSYQSLGETLSAMREKAAQDKMLPLYDKVIRDVRKNIEDAEYGENVPAIDAKKITGIPPLKVV